MTDPTIREMLAPATTIVEDCLAVTADEEVLVVGDAGTHRVAEAIALAATGTGARTVTATMPRLDSHGNEPAPTIAAAMAAADVAFTCTTHAITHTRARLRASEAGTRVGVLRGVTEAMMTAGAMTADFPALARRTRAVADVLDAASTATVTSEQGTDVAFSVEGCAAFSLDGWYHETEGFATLPPGESPTHPAEGTANGTIVVDVSMDGIGRLDEPIRLSLADGIVTEVAGGAGAAQLQAIFDRADDNARTLAEFAIGTNPAARLIGNQAEDKKRAGTVHFAVGDNESLGGTTRSDIHLDGVLGAPTVHLDDELVVDAGQLVVG